ncbi:uncharacterized protein F4812DRAFT_466974 [Daldinia caldariorum]|uniref:uncharacterized protein n=1 Tax=Daldinia caldariorum TaxID=326644 RepID=UPI002007B028|nr:uncharacterized protein F4812DRAFT_466974 [Daldinia caldariorum]KAI1464732.1 hypothetical protein F4812DRAFT_466974 [Daldinia caldariorum]
MAAIENMVRDWVIADEKDLCLITALLLDDAEQMTSAAKGKQLEGTLTDAEFALQLYSEELNNAASFASDRQMTRSIQEAIQTDQDTLVQFQREELMARNDREISRALSLGISSDTLHAEGVGSDDSESVGNLELMDKLSALYITGVEDEDRGDSDVESLLTAAGEQPESSSWAASRMPQKTARRRTCLACGERKCFTKVARAPCDHEYCRDCLVQLFQCAMADESLFPPRCCRQNIPLDKIQFLLPRGLVSEFRIKEIEFSTPRRTYCHNPTCAAFIPPQSYEGDIATCNDCGGKTCITCKGPSHYGDCPHDEDLQRVLELAQDNKWQRCPNCLSLIELNQGCFHMTCRCGSHFCYLCCAPWKNCRCRHWDEYLIYDRAAEIHDRDYRENERPDVREANIRNIVNDLREYHECEHLDWRYRYGAFRCEECRDRLPDYIFECCQCNTLACRRCRFNRL